MIYTVRIRPQRKLANDVVLYFAKAPSQQLNVDLDWKVPPPVIIFLLESTFPQFGN